MQLSSLLLLPSTITACIQYSGTYYFSPDIPFEAFISENDNVVCWISRTYTEHSRLQDLANLAPVTREQLENPDELTWGFKRWDFTCLEGRQGWANVGVRSAGYIGRDGKVMQWVADMVEDVWEEKWEYSKEVGCGEDIREARARELLLRAQAARTRIEEMQNQEAENRKRKAKGAVEDL